jgi:hypothetical protein
MTNDLQQEVMDRLKCDITIDEEGNEFWRLNGKLHRTDGPAVIYVDGRQDWYHNGKRHRVGGPAIILADGSTEWWQNGNYFCKTVTIYNWPN